MVSIVQENFCPRRIIAYIGDSEEDWCDTQVSLAVERHKAIRVSIVLQWQLYCSPVAGDQNPLALSGYLSL
jgi:hypothetical protein